MKMFKGLEKRLAVLFVSIALVATLATALAGIYSARTLFSAYLEKNQSLQAQNWAATFAEYYQQNKGFSGIENTNRPIQRGRGYGRMMGGGGSSGFVLVQTDGLVLWDSSGMISGQRLGPEQLSGAVPVEVNGATVGLVVNTSHGLNGLGTLEQDFVSSLTYYALIIAIIIGLAAVGLGIIMARRIVRPIHTMSEAAHRLAGGDLDCSIPVQGSDEIRQLAEDFNLMSESLRKTQIMRRNLTADIAHELRTPLTILRANLDEMQAKARDADQVTIANLQDEVLRMSKLVKDMEILALAETGHLVINKKRVHLEGILNKLGPVLPELDSRGIILEVEIEPDLPDVLADPDRLLQVFLNLISNALAHSSEGSKITVKVTGKDDSVNVSVADQGGGILKEQMPYIFERFYRADSARSRREGGMGLGLAITRSLVEAHGGQIWVESKPGQGSVFSFTIPHQEA
ncbi:MAG: ATP-binding protein [Syntrophomonas sp.]